MRKRKSWWPHLPFCRDFRCPISIQKERKLYKRACLIWSMTFASIVIWKACVLYYKTHKMLSYRNLVYNNTLIALCVLWLRSEWYKIKISVCDIKCSLWLSYVCVFQSVVCYVKAAFPHILELLNTQFSYAKDSDNYRYTNSLKNLIYNIYSQRCIPPINEEIEVTKSVVQLSVINRIMEEDFWLLLCFILYCV